MTTQHITTDQIDIDIARIRRKIKDYLSWLSIPQADRVGYISDKEILEIEQQDKRILAYMLIASYSIHLTQVAKDEGLYVNIVV